MDPLPKIVLPFDRRRKRKNDWGEWVWEHRITLMSCLIVYLLFGIAIVGWRISVNSSGGGRNIEINFEDLNKIEQEYRRQIEINRALLAASGGPVRNEVSNDAGQLNTTIRDDRGTDAGQLYADADAVQARLQAGSEAYRSSRQTQSQPTETTSGSTSSTGETTRKAGRVTVAYTLVNPIRSAVKVITPSYQCEGGGVITMAITVNRNGDVIAASVVAAQSNGDECMVRTARAAALSSRFNAISSAPERQTGTITYEFIPQ